MWNTSPQMNLVTTTGALEHFTVQSKLPSVYSKATELNSCVAAKRIASPKISDC